MDRFYDFAKDHENIKLLVDDKNGMNYDLNEDMASGVEESNLVVVFLTNPYFESENCRLEINYAHALKKPIIIVKLNKDLNILGRGAVSLIISSKLYVRINNQRLLINY